MKISSFLLFFFCSSSLFSQEETKPSIGTPMVIVVPDTTVQIEYDRNAIIDFPEVEAQFKGGQIELQKFISENFVYSKESIEQGVSGKVYVSFVVEKNGSISTIIVEKGVAPALDQDVVNVIKKMPKWQPAKNNGKKVRQRCRLPVKCSVN